MSVASIRKNQKRKKRRLFAKKKLLKERKKNEKISNSQPSDLDEDFGTSKKDSKKLRKRDEIISENIVKPESSSGGAVQESSDKGVKKENGRQEVDEASKIRRSKKNRNKSKRKAAFKKSKKNAKSSEMKDDLHTLNESFNKKDVVMGDFTLLGETDALEKEKVERVLPHWLSHPINIDRSLENGSKLEDVTFLDPRIIEFMKSKGMSSLFPVQSCVIPEIIKGFTLDYRIPPRDVCCASPTGSGKTLAYVLPIIQRLSQERFRAVRALVILPVLDIAMQVYNVFDQYCKIFELRIGRTFGLLPFEKEQANLVEVKAGVFRSRVDIIVATPGRLLDHMNRTPGLDFSRLRFLVFDEADQLLVKGLAEVIGRIQRHIEKFQKPALNMAVSPCFHPLFYSNSMTHDQMDTTAVTGNEGHLSSKSNADDSSIFSSMYKPPIECESDKNYTVQNLPNSTNFKGFDFSTVKRGNRVSLGHRSDQSCDRSNFQSFDNWLTNPCIPPEFPGIPMQRLLFSATLSVKPQELQNISLYRPILYVTKSDSSDAPNHTFIADRVVTTATRPDTLSEQYVVTTLDVKPLLLHYIISKEMERSKSSKILVFVSSVAVTLKLTVLLRSMSRKKYSTNAFNSEMGSRRELLVKRFRSGKINVLVSSDAMARGMDLPNVDMIISYDLPSSITYVHRIGRTARAGREGRALSIVTEDEVRQFKKLFLGGTFKGVQKICISDEELQIFEEPFREALAQLDKETMGNEAKPKSMKRSRLEHARIHKKRVFRKS